VDSVAEAWRVLEDQPGDRGQENPAAAQPSAAPAESRRWWAFLTLGILFVVAGAGWLLTSGASGGNLAINAAQQPRELAAASIGASPAASGARPTAGDTGAAAEQDRLVVDVNGAVRRPGVYRLVAGARVSDAITAAGGFGPRVDAAATQGINLAARLSDGQQIHVPSRDERATPGESAAAAATGAAAGAAAGGPVNLNTATAAQLEALPAIGPATAAKIIAARAEQPFQSVEELRGRKIVGAATLEKIRGLVTVR
jgi:competence protein ComEA